MALKPIKQESSLNPIKQEVNTYIVLVSSSREGDGTPLQCSYLENPMDRGAWWAAVQGVEKSWKQLSD